MRIALLAVILLCSGCFEAPKVVNAEADELQVELKKTKEDLAKAQGGVASLTGIASDEHRRSMAADKALDDAKGLVKTAELNANQAHADEDAAKYEAMIAPVRTILLTVTIVGALLAIAGGVVFALSFVSTALGFGRLIGVIGLVAGVVAVILAQAVNMALTHLVWVIAGGLGLLLAGFIGWLIYDRHKGQQTTREALSVGDDAMTRLEQMGASVPEAAAHALAVKSAAKARQVGIGIKHHVERALAKVRA